MIRNKRGQVSFFAFMLGIVVLVVALSFAQPVKQQVDIAMNNNSLDCDNSSINDFNKAACISTDLTTFYFIGGLIFVAGAVMVAKIVFT